MTKREAFSAAVCLTGIWQIITALSRLASLLLFFTGASSLVNTRSVVIGSVLVTALELSIGIVLTFASRPIAAVLLPSDGPLELACLDGFSEQLIVLYSKLLGLLVTITGALKLVAAAMEWGAWSPITSAGPVGNRALAAIAQIIVGLLLIFCSAAVARALSPKGPEVSTGSEGSGGSEGADG